MGHFPAAVLELSLNTAEKELKYANSKHAIELISKDEDMRRLRAELFLIEDDAEELRDQLQHEQESSERTRQLVDEHLVRAQEAEIDLEAHEQELRKRDHEIGRLQAENQSLKSTTHDANTILAEKLALSRELSILKPELEHFKAQEANTEQLRSDKLALQRQLSEAQCEIEAARADAKRAQAKRRNTTMEIAQEEQVSDLKKELARERRLRANAEEATQQAQADMKSDDVRRELAKEKKLREKLEQEFELLRETTQVDDVRRDLSKTRKAKHRLQLDIDGLQNDLEKEKQATQRAVKRAEGDSNADDAIKDLQAQLTQEQETRSTMEKAARKKEEHFETERAELEDKLNQFRTKLREKKEELKTAKEELAASKTRVEKAEVSAKAVDELPPTKVPTKKAAVSKRAGPAIAQDEATLGTPGDGPKTKRNRQAKPAAVGEKSSFSITPFLNKTSVLNVEEDLDNSAMEASPSVDKQAKTPLAPAASIKGNRQPKKNTQQRDKKSALTAVVEEEEPATQPKPIQQATISPAKPVEEAVQKDKPVPKRKQKSRKSLTDFKSFQKDDEPVKQKKRRLGGRAPTLFDEEEEATDVTRPTSRGGLFGPAAYAKLATSKKATPGVRSSALGRSMLVSAADGTGFQFSPLKRTRKNLDDTLKA